MSALKQLLTGKDNQTHDIIRWCAFGATIEGLALAAWDVLAKGHAFDLQQFGIGCGALFAATGAALAFKASTEPGDRP